MCTDCFVIWHCLSCPSFISSLFIFINLLKSDVPGTLKKIFNNGVSSF